MLTAVNHHKARAIFLDPGEGDAKALEELRDAFLHDPVPGVTLPPFSKRAYQKLVIYVTSCGPY